MKIRLTKLSELADARHPNNIEVGHIVEDEFVDDPKVGFPFYIGSHWRTSIVREIINENTFRTLNSLYRWEEIKYD